jgi:hypothetical protein
LLLALGVGISVGFAAGYGVGNHDRTTAQSAAAPAPPPAPASSAKEFTESAVPAAPESPAASRQPPAASTQPPAASVQPSAAGRQASAPDASGRLLVRSTPSGARVRFDGKDAGVTPFVAHDVATGAHQVQVSRDGYVTVDRRVVITKANPAQSLTIPLEREPVASSGTRAAVPEPSTPGTMGRFAGGLRIESRPTGAKVFLDGKLIGTTPLAVASVSAGEHAVRLEYDGYRRWSSSVRVVASEQNRVTASLER